MQRLILVKLNAAFTDHVDESTDCTTDLSQPLPSWLINMNKCGTEQGYRECRHCQELHPMLARCSNRWCLMCNWRVSFRRQQVLAEWMTHMRDPFHLVTTQRGFHHGLHSKITELRENMMKLRRQDVFDKVRGGCASIEFTRSDSHGWHMHTHWLLDTPWIDMAKLAKDWGKLTGQQFGIVHFTADKSKDFTREVCKYVVKGSELMKWTGAQIREAIEACWRRRLFNSFGTLAKLGPMIRADMKQRLDETPRVEWECKECGCLDSDMRFHGKAAKEIARSQILDEIKVYAGLRNSGVAE